MANPMYGQNKADGDIAVYGRGKMNVITHTSGTTNLQSEDSGSVIFVNDADGIVQLPAAEAGLQFKVIIGIDATATATVADYDTLDFTSNSATLAGGSGDTVELLCIDGTAWCVNATLVTVHADPASTAIINAS